MTAQRIPMPAWIPALLQLAIASLVVYWYQIEREAFLRLFILASFGFSIHAFLPVTYRLPFFTLLSMGAALLVFSPVDSLWLLASGTMLIGLANAPVSIGARVWLLISTGALLAAARTGIVPVPWSTTV